VILQHQSLRGRSPWGEPYVEELDQRETSVTLQRGVGSHNSGRGHDVVVGCSRQARGNNAGRFSGLSGTRRHAGATLVLSDVGKPVEGNGRSAT
jgi:hypothetical protein